MLGDQVGQIANSLGFNPKFIGVFSLEELPQRPMEVGQTLIANTLPARLQLTGHWVAITKTGRNSYYFFDSMGRQPGYYNFHNWAPPWTVDKLTRSNGKRPRVDWNRRRIQSNASLDCGLFAGYYTLAVTVLGKRPQAVSKEFRNRTLHKNDEIVRRKLNTLVFM